MNTNIAQSSSKTGSLVYGEDLTNSYVLFENTQVTDMMLNQMQSILVVLNYGKLTIFNSTFANLSSSLFQLNEMKVEFDGVKINQITCDSYLSCLINGKSLDLQILNTTITKITSNNNLMSLISCSNILFEELELQNINPLSKNILNQEIYTIQVISADHLLVKDSYFKELDFSVFKIKASNFSLTQTIFSNKESNRLLTSTGKRGRATQFVNLEESNSLMIESIFLGGEKAYGGVI